MFFNTFFTAILLATATVAAPVIRPQELVVFDPHIISPKAAVAWPMGSRQTVKWGECKLLCQIVLFIFLTSLQPKETNGIPAEMIHDTGVILLGHMENESENLDIGMSRPPFLTSCVVL